MQDDDVIGLMPSYHCKLPVYSTNAGYFRPNFTLSKTQRQPQSDAKETALMHSTEQRSVRVRILIRQVYVIVASHSYSL